MTKTSYVWVAVVAVVLIVGGLFFAAHRAPVQGSIANGITQQQPWNFLQGLTGGTSGQWFVTNAGVETNAGVTNTGNTTNSGSVTIGGTASFHKITDAVSVTSTLNAVTLGSVAFSTSTATSTVTITGLSGSELTVGQPCLAGLTTAPATGFGLDFNLTSSTATVATGTITEWNGLAGNVTVATGTLRLTCLVPGTQ